MKKNLCVIVAVLGLMTFAHANEMVGETGHIFNQTGSAQCVQDCSVSAREAMEDAISRANSVCAPSSATQVSDWKIDVRGYGRLFASAFFSCETNEIQ